MIFIKKKGAIKTILHHILVIVLFFGWQLVSAQNNLSLSATVQVCSSENGKLVFIGLSPEDFPSAFDSVYLFIDDQSLPKYYYQDIFTPVCEDNSCKPVYIT